MIIIAFQNYEKPKVWLTIFFIVIILIILLKILLSRVSNYNYYSVQIKNINNLNDNAIINYLFIYIFPFITLDFSNIKGIMVFLYLFSLLGYIYLRNNIVYINPILNIFFKYNIYSVEIISGNASNTLKIMLLSKRQEIDLRRNKHFKVYMLGKNIFLDNSNEKKP